MTSGKRNRAAGHTWERELASLFRMLGFPHVVTTRSESRARDNQKVDLINKDERKNGRFVFNVQAKNAVGHIPYGKLLAEMPDEPGVINVIAHKQTERRNTRFVGTGEFVVMNLNDFLTMVKIATKEGYLTPELVQIYGEPTPEVDGTLTRGIEKTVLHGTGIIPWKGVQGGKDMAQA
jgi:hypothetical protein